MNPTMTTTFTPHENRKAPYTPNLRKHMNLWAWTVLLIIINLPLLWGEVRTELLFLPEAVNSGEWWRVVTYPLVHLSWYHLLLDAGGFLLLLSCLEERRIFVKGLYLISTSAASLLLALAMDQSMHQSGLSGLSGMAHGLMAITSLEMLRHGNQRVWGAVSLTAVVAKSAYEVLAGHVLFEFMHMGLCGQPVAASHAGGVLGGVLVFFLFNSPSKLQDRAIRNKIRQPVEPAPSSATVQSIIGVMIRALTPFMYRVRYEGLNHIPSKGPAVLVCNHVSYIDWLIIASACRRPVHFVMHASIYNLPVLNWILRPAGIIPIDSGRKNPVVLRQAFKKMTHVLQSGGLVCIFPEGHLTRTGRINRFRPGVEKIIEQTPVSVIPLALRGLWGSYFSHKGGPAMRGRPHLIWRRITLSVGKGIPHHHVTAPHLQKVVETLRGEAS